MVQIQPISIWNNGQIKTAIFLNLQSVFDNLKDSATFYYQLLSEDQSVLADGNLQMVDPDYTNYSTSLDSNKFAYDWAAQNLNLIIVNYESLTSDGNRETINGIGVGIR
jgi:hypothetical protein